MNEGIRQRSDGTWEAISPSGRVWTSIDRAALERMLGAQEQATQASERFLAAWKRAVVIIGPAYFQVRSVSVEGATDKWDLEPHWDAINNLVRSPISPGERTFIAACCSFYNSEWGQELLGIAGEDRLNICDIASTLDDERQEIVAELFLNYRGW